MPVEEQLKVDLVEKVISATDEEACTRIMCALGKLQRPLMFHTSGKFCKCMPPMFDKMQKADKTVVDDYITMWKRGRYKKNSADILRVLLDKGLKADDELLLKAVLSNKELVVDILIKHGANVRYKSPRSGYSAMDWAKMLQFTESEAMLRKAGARPDVEAVTALRPGKAIIEEYKEHSVQVAVHRLIELGYHVHGPLPKVEEDDSDKEDDDDMDDEDDVDDDDDSDNIEDAEMTDAVDENNSNCVIS